MKASCPPSTKLLHRTTFLATMLTGLVALVLVGLTSASLTQPNATEAKGIDAGGKVPMVFVAREQTTWEKVKEAFGAPKMLPIGMKKGGDLGLLDGTDFQKEMIVAVLWGEMNFSSRDEKCWIEEVAILKDEVVVDCRATLWGGAVDASFRAWPYHVKVVPRSALPVRFKQTTVWTAPPGRTDKDKTVGTMRDGEWKHEFPPKK